MSNFWKMSTGEKPEENKEYAADVGGFDPIAANTQLLALIDEASWKTAYVLSEPDAIQIRWVVLAPEEFKNRKIFQKIKVLDKKETTADNAKRMLMAIDSNASGKLAKLDNEPEDNELVAALVNSSMVIRVQVWEMEGRSGNWVSAVAPKNSVDKTAMAENNAAAAENKPPQKTSLKSGVAALDNDDIPF